VLPADFGIVVGMEGPRVAVAVSGHLDSQSAAYVRDVIVGIVRAGHRNLVVDLGTIRSIDAIGLRILTQALKRCRSQGGEMVFRFAAT
jgi:anti-sigma B factor antagonist